MMVNKVSYSNHFLHLRKGEPCKFSKNNLESYPSFPQRSKFTEVCTLRAALAVPVLPWLSDVIFLLLCQVEKFGNLYANTVQALAV